MNKNRRAYLTLLGAMEETPLWDILNDCVSVAPDTPREEHLSSSRDIIREMVTRGWIQVSWMPAGDYQAAFVPIPSTEVREVLQSSSPWTWTKDGCWVIATATDEGRAAFPKIALEADESELRELGRGK